MAITIYNPSVYNANGERLPTVYKADNGKVLTVVNGEWKAADPTASVSSVPGDDLPKVTANDNGKFLRVVNGSYALVSVTDVSKGGA